MSDETNVLLRQILETQRQLLVVQQNEVEKVAEFRVVAMRMQKAGLRRQSMAIIIIVIGAAALLVYAASFNG